MYMMNMKMIKMNMNCCRRKKNSSPRDIAETTPLPFKVEIHLKVQAV